MASATRNTAVIWWNHTAYVTLFRRSSFRLGGIDREPEGDEEEGACRAKRRSCKNPIEKPVNMFSIRTVVLLLTLVVTEGGNTTTTVEKAIPLRTAVKQSDFNKSVTGTPNVLRMTQVDAYTTYIAGEDFATVPEFVKVMAAIENGSKWMEANLSRSVEKNPAAVPSNIREDGRWDPEKHKNNSQAFSTFAYVLLGMIGCMIAMVFICMVATSCKEIFTNGFYGTGSRVLDRMTKALSKTGDDTTNLLQESMTPSTSGARSLGYTGARSALMLPSSRKSCMTTRSIDMQTRIV
ncbi:uncharacterized protein LOC135400557 [Ornithodoros turicata]|uniref:uncharacterized protein LOC135400557 n=1 Tax=Ornithodoros turicata TaxID=34597 RepID=UPI0031390CD0